MKPGLYQLGADYADAKAKLLRKPWRERVEDARKRGRFTLEDEQLAGWWGSCAVGEQQMRMPEVKILQSDTCPLDDVLCQLGSWSVGFTSRVQMHDPAGAAAFLDEIEDRALQIKRGAA